MNSAIAVAAEVMSSRSSRSRRIQKPGLRKDLLPISDQSRSFERLQRIVANEFRNCGCGRSDVFQEQPFTPHTEAGPEEGSPSDLGPEPKLRTSAANSRE